MFKRKYPKNSGARFQSVSLKKDQHHQANIDEDDDDNHAGQRMMEDELEESLTNRKFAEIEQSDILDAQMGFKRFQVGPPRQGWLVNLHATLVKDSEWNGGRSALDCYFMQDDGECFKATVIYSPYFFIKVREGKENEAEDYLKRKFENTIENIVREEKEDLDMVMRISLIFGRSIIWRLEIWPYILK